MEGRKLSTLDESEVLARLQRHAQRLWEQADG
jgi:hypothetical protein